jgi:murein DD-endopeptidase MepM/ murein hydrolase activator NlpD
MSHSSAAAHPHTAEHRRRPRARPAAAVSRYVHRSRGGYTLQHAGHQIRVGPVAFWIVVGTLVAMAVWSILTGTYFAFREDVLTGLIGRETKMQFAYEDRIAELRAEVDRITSRQLLDQQQFAQKLKTLLDRQAALERRTDALAGDGLTTGSIPPARSAKRAPAAPPPNLSPPKPKPISDTVIYVAPPDREARLQSRLAPAGATRLAMRDAGGLDGMVARVSASLDKVAQRQRAALGNIEERVDNKARRMHSVLADLGIHIGKIPRRAAGGPFMPVRPPKPGASAFNRQFYRVALARARIAHYDRVLIDVPVRKPVAGPIDVNSPFGVRTDPFNGRPAMHTGVDLHGDYGEPVYATAAGTVTKAGRDGGYGNLVEIRHGNGISTRYGHLSAIEVKVGQKVRVGQVIGKIGSTGRSTGPHLHYETRVDGKPVNPQKFLRAGLRLGHA